MHSFSMLTPRCITDLRWIGVAEITMARWPKPSRGGLIHAFVAGLWEVVVRVNICTSIVFCGLSLFALSSQAW